MLRGFCPTGPGGGVDPSCGGGDGGSSSLPGSTEDVIAEGTSNLYDSSEQAGKWFNDIATEVEDDMAWEVDEDVDEYDVEAAVGKLQEAHDGIAEDFGVRAERATEDVKDDVYGAFHPGEDSEYAGDFEDDWDQNTAEFDTSANAAESELTGHLESEREIAEEAIRAVASGDAGAAAAMERLAGANGRLDTAVERWHDQITAATESLIARVRIYGEGDEAAARAQRKAFCPTGPGGGSDPSCGGGGDSGGETPADAAVGRGYSEVSEAGQTMAESFDETLDSDGSVSDKIDDIYATHDDAVAEVEDGAGSAAKDVTDHVFEEYHPGADSDLAEDFESDWSEHQDNFTASVERATGGVRERLGQERDLAEEVALAEDSGDAEAPALRQRLGGAADRIEAAAEGWMRDVEAATARLIGDVDGQYGQERSVETLAAIVLATLYAGNAPEWSTLIALREQVAMATGFCPTGPGGGVDPSCGGGGASFENAEAAEDHFSAQHKTKLRNGGKMSDEEFVKTAEKLSDEMDRLTGENKAVKKAIKNRVREQRLEIGTYLGADRDGQYREGEGIELGHRLAVDNNASPSFGGFSTGTDFESVWRHELGHEVRLSLPKGKQRDWGKVAAKYEGTSTISRYGGTNPSELFSESFSAYTSPRYSRGSLPADVEGWLDTNIRG